MLEFDTEELILVMSFKIHVLHLKLHLDLFFIFMCSKIHVLQLRLDDKVCNDRLKSNWKFGATHGPIGDDLVIQG